MGRNAAVLARAMTAAGRRGAAMKAKPIITVLLLAFVATLGVAGAILVEAALSFLGLGVQPPTPEWGAMLSNARASPCVSAVKMMWY
mgnify:CR=1 FL=1